MHNRGHFFYGLPSVLFPLQGDAVHDFVDVMTVAAKTDPFGQFVFCQTSVQDSLLRDQSYGADQRVAWDESFFFCLKVPNCDASDTFFSMNSENSGRE